MRVAACLLAAIVAIAAASGLPSAPALVRPALIAPSGLNLRADLYEWIQHPPEWQRLSRADAHARMSFAIGLVPANRDKLEAIFWDVTNPDSANYQKWLSFDEVTRMTDPGQAVVQPVLDWLHSVTGVTTHVLGEIIRVEAPVSAVEALFATRMSVFRNRNTNKDIIRHVGKTSVPRHLRQSIAVVEGIHEFPPRHHAVRAVNLPGAFSVNAPSTYAKLYNIPAGTVVKSKASNGCFAQYAADGAPKQTDLTAFDANAGVPKQTFNYNGEADSVTGLEATLDIQTMTAVAPNANTTFFMQQNWMYVFTSDLLSLGSGCPDVLSISYGWNEDQQCSDILHDLQVCKQHGWNGTQYISAVDANLIKLGAAGVTIIASSGDNGAPGDQNVNCQLDSQGGTYPAYPASSPYLLSVGATQIVGSGTGIDASPRKLGPVCTVWKCSEDAYPALKEAPAQTANASFTTGGGFSVVEPQPSYQATAVNAYLASGVALPPATKFNSKGRGYPDVASIGQNNMIVDAGQWTVSGGTSAAGPIWNGIITLLNDYLLTNNKKTLGFVNPLLYKIAASTPTAFNTIQPGNNKCTEQSCCQYGFLENPKGGWSPVTGLGSPNFGVIVNYLKTNIVEKKN